VSGAPTLRGSLGLIAKPEGLREDYDPETVQAA
jgi:hypothetical protein